MSQKASLDQQRDDVLRRLKTLDPSAPISATTVFAVGEGHTGAFEVAIATLARATSGMHGLKTFDHVKHLSVQPDASWDGRYLIYEKWESVTDFIAQWTSDHLQKFQAAVLDLVTQSPALNFYAGAQAARVLRTGQDRCWDQNGRLVPCGGTGADGDIRAGVPWPQPRFLDNNNGSVTDQLTGLIWLRNANAYGEIPWDQALANAATLGQGQCGLTDSSKPGDWRLPNLNEYQSLFDLNNTSGPCIVPDHPFINLYPANYWTSSSVALAPALGWFVASGVGPPVFDLKMNSMRMWAVRGGEQPRIAQTGQKLCFNDYGQPVDCKGSGQDPEFHMGIPFPSPRFIDNGNGTVTDQLTQLVWLKNANFFGTRSWRHSLEACRSLASGTAGLHDSSKAGHWRLPNLFELRSLVDYSMHSPALTEGHPFENVIPSLYWSSTTVASAPNLARFVFIGVGPSVWDHKSVLMHVWPVSGGVLEHHPDR